MELSSQDHGEMPVPINSTYGGHIIHHNPSTPLPLPTPQNHNNIVTNSVPPVSTNGPIDDSKKAVKYKECLKNHAASMGGNATDGCGEFMPSGEEGSIEAFTCSVCNCHRNFHRKEIDGLHNHSSSCDCYHHLNLNNRSGIGRKLILGHHFGTPQYPTTATALVPSRPAQPHQMIMSSYNNMMASLPSESDEQEDGNNNSHQNGFGVGSTGVLMARPPHLLRKRFRTKFSQEQKEKMLNFAEKVGWKIQKQEEAVVQQFCQEIGVKRRVLKVWMHNNKHILAKKNCTNSTPTLENPVE
ncbi:zinc-finger homeodomain protein 2-like [Apium graveolens]|uniref:zinc-finger homeodomain protein 2-like n=1 Tax=Apium graveolens TaxID=4045 RepID=UPI003D78FBEF